MAQPEAPQEGSEIEKLLRDYQLTQEQLRTLAMQIEQMQSQKIEMERAKEELDKSSGKVYFSVGGVIVETTKDKAVADINDRHSLTSARIQTFNKQYNDVKAREKQLNEKLTQIYKQSKGA